MSAATELGKQLERLVHELNVLEAADSLQRAAIRDLEKVLSEKICEGLRPEWGQLVGRLEATRREIRDVRQALADFRAELERNRVNVTLPDAVDDERRIEQELRGQIRRLQGELNLVNQGGRRGRLVPTGVGARV